MAQPYDGLPLNAAAKSPPDDWTIGSRLGLRGKSIVFVVSVFLAVGVATLWAMDAVGERIAAQLGTYMAERHVLWHKERVLGAVNRELALSRKMAESVTLRQWATAEDDPAIASLAREELQSFHDTFSAHSYFVGLTESKHFFYADETTKTIELNIIDTLSADDEDDIWFFQTIADSAPFNLNVDHNVQLGVTNLWVNYAMRSGDRTLGVVGTGVRLTRFIETFIEQSTPGVTTMLIDGGGFIQAHQDTAKIERNVLARSDAGETGIWGLLDTEADKAALRQGLASLKAGSSETESLLLKVDGARLLVSIAYLAPLDWYTMAMMEPGAVMGAREIGAIAGVLAIALILTVVLLVVAQNSQVIKPLLQLTQGAERLAKGDYDVRLPIRQHDEIGYLTRTFNDMAAIIVDATQTLEARVAERVAELEQKQFQLDNLNSVVLRLDLNGSVIHINDFGQKLFGFTEDEFIGKPIVGTIVPETDSAGRDLAFMIGDIINNPLKYEHNENENQCKDGRRIWMLWRNLPVRDATGVVTEILSVGIDITERKRAEERLQESERQVRLVLDESPVGVAITRAKDGSFAFSNPRGREILHVSDLEDGTFNARDFYADPEERRAITKALAEGHAVRDREARLKLPDETEIHVLTSVSAFEHEGEPAWLSWYYDITDRKRAEQEIAHHTQLAEMMHRLTSVANEATDTEQVLKETLDEVCAYTGWPLGHAYVVDPEDPDCLTPSGLWHVDDVDQFRMFKELTEETTFQRGEGLPGRVFAEGRPAWNIDVESDPNFPRAKVAHEIGIRTGFAFPMLSHNKVIAVLEFFSSERTQADEDLQSALTDIGVQIGRVEERKRAREELRQSEQRLHALLAESPAGVSISRVDDGTIVFSNPRARSMFGVTADSIEGFNAREFYADAEQRKTVGRLLHENGFIRDQELRLKRIDGSEFHALTSTTPFEFEGEPAWVTWSYDVTELKEAEARVRESEANLRSLLESSPVGVAMLRKTDLHRLYMNPAFVKMFGGETTTAEELAAARTEDSFVNPDDLKWVTEKLMSDPPVVTMELERKRPDGTIWWCLISRTRIIYQGEETLVNWHFDITERKQAEAKLQESEQRLGRILEESPVGVSITRAEDGQYLYGNSRLADQFGMTVPELLNSRSVERYADPAQRGPLMARFKADGFVHDAEVLFKRTDGTDFWALATISPFDFEGEPALLTWHYDITELKRAEAETREKTQILSDVLDNVAQGIVKYDGNRNLLIWNKQFQDALGLPDDLMTPGRPVIDLAEFLAKRGDYGDGDPISIAKQRVDGLFKGKAGRSEVKFGGEDTYDVLTQPTADDGLVITYTDITDRKQAEEAIRASQKNLETILTNSPMGVTINDEASAERLYSNPRFLELFGANSEAELASINVADTFVNPEELRTMLELFASDDPIVGMEVEKRRMDGTKWWSLVVRTKIQYDGRPTLLNWHIDITERKRAEEEVAAKEAQLRVALDNMSDGIFLLDSDLRYVLFNEQYKDLLDAPDEVVEIGGKFEDVLGSQVKRGDFTAEAAAALVDDYKSGEATAYERTIGSERILEFKRSPTTDGGVVAIISDITERKEAEDQLRASEQRLLSILQQSPIGVTIIRPSDGRMMFVNSRLAEQFGAAEESLIGTSIAPYYVDSEARAAIIKAFDRDGYAYDFEVEMVRSDQSRFWSLVSVLPVEHEDEPCRLTWYYDITQRKDAERALTDAYEVISSSIQYASRIQRSILPDDQLFQEMFSDYFVHWEPRDVVGGDIYWCNRWGDGAVFMLGDCTGHGVPGAFMTLIAVGALDRAQIEVAEGDVAKLMQRVHQLVQITVNQHVDSGESDDGMELGICYLHPDHEHMTYVGARFSLFAVENGDIAEIKGDRAGIGYRGIPHDQIFTETVVDLRPGRHFYMTSDGLIDQVGGTKRRSFGKRRFKDLIKSFNGQGFDTRRAAIVDAFKSYQGEQTRRDDVAVMGFAIKD